MCLGHGRHGERARFPECEKRQRNSSHLQGGKREEEKTSSVGPAISHTKFPTLDGKQTGGGKKVEISNPQGGGQSGPPDVGRRYLSRILRLAVQETTLREGAGRLGRKVEERGGDHAVPGANPPGKAFAPRPGAGGSKGGRLPISCALIAISQRQGL